MVLVFSKDKYIKIDMLNIEVNIIIDDGFVHISYRLHHILPLLKRIEALGIRFIFCDTFIALNGHNQSISQLFCPIEEPYMSNMQQIEHSKCKDSFHVRYSKFTANDIIFSAYCQLHCLVVVCRPE